MGEILAEVKPVEVSYNFDNNEFEVLYRINIAGENYQITRRYDKNNLEDESAYIQEKINAHLDRLTQYILERIGDIPIKWYRFDILITKLF